MSRLPQICVIRAVDSFFFFFFPDLSAVFTVLTYSWDSSPFDRTVILNSLEEPGRDLLGFSLSSAMYVRVFVIFLQVVVVVVDFLFI